MILFAASSAQKISTCALRKRKLESLEAEANKSIDLKEFIPLAAVDPVYFEDTHLSGSG